MGALKGVPAPEVERLKRKGGREGMGGKADSLISKGGGLFQKNQGRHTRRKKKFSPPYGLNTDRGPGYRAPQLGSKRSNKAFQLHLPWKERWPGLTCPTRRWSAKEKRRDARVGDEEKLEGSRGSENHKKWSRHDRHALTVRIPVKAETQHE